MWSQAQGEKVGPEQGRVEAQVQSSNKKPGEPQAFDFSHYTTTVRAQERNC